MADRRVAQPMTWRHYVLPMTLCFGVGFLYTAAWPALGLARIMDALPSMEGAASTAAGLPQGRPDLAATNAALAKAGGLAAYRSYAAATLAIAVGVMLLAVIAISRFVRDRQARRILFTVLAAQAGLAVSLRLSLGGELLRIVDNVLCEPGGRAAPWDVCAWVGTSYPLNDIVGAVGAAATAATVFAVFIVASTRAPSGLPTLIGSAERCVTLLLGAASTLLVAAILMQRSFLDWAFAGFMVLDKPPAGIAHFIGGMSTALGLMQTAMLGVAWFVSLILLERTGQGPQGDKKAASPGPAASGLSVYNLSAILAPALSAIASNLLSG